MKLARWIFLIAGIWGILVLTPQYFLETLISNQHPPAITDPEFFYGFAGVGLAWQILFVIIATDRSVIAEPCWLAWSKSRLSSPPSSSFTGPIEWIQRWLGAAAIDVLLGILLVIAFVTAGNRGSSALNRNG